MDQWVCDVETETSVCILLTKLDSKRHPRAFLPSFLNLIIKPSASPFVASRNYDGLADELNDVLPMSVY